MSARSSNELFTLKFTSLSFLLSKMSNSVRFELLLEKRIVLSAKSPSGPPPPGRQLQPARPHAPLLLRRDGRQQVHPGLRVLGQLVQGLLGGLGKDRAGLI